MMRRFTSAPNPCSRVRAYIVRSASWPACVVGTGADLQSSREIHIERRHSARDSSSPRQWRPGSTRPSRTSRAAARCRRARRRGQASASSDAVERARDLGDRRPVRAAAAARPRARAADIAGQRRRIIGHRLGRAGRVRRVGARDHAERDRRIVDGPRQRPDLIERGTERDQAVPRDAAVGGLQIRRRRTSPPVAESIRRCRTRAPAE